jgi:transposase
MARYKEKEAQSGQGFFLEVNLRRQLVPGSFEWALDRITDRDLDFSGFDEVYKNDKEGRPGIDPRSLFKLYLYGCSKGQMSSRKQEELSRDNIIAKALMRDVTADHSTIAEFISKNSEKMKALEVQVLMVCKNLGLIGGEMFAIDGLRLPGNASERWSGRLKDLEKRQKLAEKKIGGVKERETRKKEKLEEKKAEIEAQIEAVKEQMLEEQRAEWERWAEEAVKKQINNDKAEVKDIETDVKRAERTLKKLEHEVDYIKGFLAGAHERKGVSGKEIQSNITDNESGKIRTKEGTIQGYVGEGIADAKSQIIVASGITGNSCEGPVFPQMMKELEENMKKISGEEKPLEGDVILADPNYSGEENIKLAEEKGMKAVIADKDYRKRDERFHKEGNKGGKGREDEQRMFTTEDFSYNEEKDEYTCPAGKVLKRMPKSSRGYILYKMTRGKEGCTGCPYIDRCIRKHKKNEQEQTEPKQAEQEQSEQERPEQKQTAQEQANKAEAADRKKKPSGPKRKAKELSFPDPDAPETACSKMRKTVDSEEGRRLYANRIAIIEPVWANIKTAKGLDHLTYRGKDKAGTQWLMYILMHNIGKCAVPYAQKKAA